MTDDIRDQLRQDHESVLAELEALRSERDEQRGLALLRQLRRSWVIHALAEETVVYRALEGIEAANDGSRADERFVEHELVEGLFDKLTRSRPSTLEWHARINVARDLIMRHIETEHADTFAQLEQRFDEEQRAELGQRFRLAREKLTMLEEAKAA
ncbi:MAG TPA: hemerythrin domain-containing protein [Usitatibacter sp.]|nr:hemerythrin domain-containing protein [Usitatibacter sp.]